MRSALARQGDTTIGTMGTVPTPSTTTRASPGRGDLSSRGPKKRTSSSTRGRVSHQQGVTVAPCESLLPEDLIIIAHNAWSNEVVNFLHKRQLNYCCGAKLCVAEVSQVFYFHGARKDWLGIFSLVFENAVRRDVKLEVCFESSPLTRDERTAVSLRCI